MIGNPGTRLTSRNRFAQTLLGQERAAPPIQSHSQGLASLLRQGLAGYMQGADAGDRASAYRTMMDQLQPGPTATSAPMAAGQYGPGASVTRSPYENAAAALAGMEGNEYAAELGRQVALAGLLRRQQLSDAERAAERDSIRRAQERRNQLADSEAAFNRQMQIEQMRRKTGLSDTMAELQARDALARSRSRDDALRDLNTDRANFGLPPLSLLPGEGASASAGVAGETESRPQTMAEARAAAAAEQERAKLRAKIEVDAQSDLPRVEANAQEILSVLDQIATFDDRGNVIQTHPGFSDLVGMPGWGGLTDMVPFIGGPVRGTRAANFQGVLKQIQGKAFLEAYNSLRGGGQITEVEGEKAEQSIARMSKAQSEEAFLESLKEFRGIVERGVERARQKAGVAAPSGDEWEPIN
jgi:hypothetical protein